MRNKDDTNSQTEQQLADLFSRMRREDGENLPAFPDWQELAARRSMLVKNRPLAVLPKVAAAAVLVIATGVLVSNQSRQDPGELYASIMDANSIATDQLMLVSPGTSPETTPLPDISEFGLYFEQSQQVN